MKRTYADAGFPILVRTTKPKRYRNTKYIPPRRIVNLTPRAGPPMVRYMPRTPGGQVIAENHYFDSELQGKVVPVQTTSWTATSCNPTGPNTLVAPTQGDDINQRNARRIFVKKIRITGTIKVAAQANQSAGDPGCIVRMILYQDKQTNGSQAGVDNLVISSGAALNATLMHQSTNTFGRFRVWKDKTWVIENPACAALTSAGTTLVQQGLVKYFKWSIKPNCYMNFNITNGGTVADIVDNSFNIIANADNGSLGPTLDYKCRAVFTP